MMEIIVLPYHGQGHMNTMLQFSKRIAWKQSGLIHVTLATTLNTHTSLTSLDHDFKFISIATIYDDTDDPTLDFWARFENFQAQAPLQLAQLITSLKPTSSKCLLVYDANLPWALDVAKQHGIPAAAFFTQACAYVASFYPMFLDEYGGRDRDHPLLSAPPLTVALPPPEEIHVGLTSVQPLSSNSSSKDDDDDDDDDDGTTKGKKKKEEVHPIIKKVLSHITNLHLADWVLFNSFDHLEQQVVKWMENIWRVRTVGPTLPSTYLDNRVEFDVGYGFNLYKSNNEGCIDWLNSKQAASVVYVSFGSAARLSEEQMANIAKALKEMTSSFLWTVRETEKNKLPHDFISETSNKGLVVSWCPQLDVLAHEAVGCFITHCGWNSTIEALSFGVPMVAMPQFMDQMIDAHFVDHVWGVGIRPKANEKGLVSCEEIKHCMGEIMHGEKAAAIKETAAKWKASAKEAVDQGGSSDKHIDELIDWLASS